jgi:tRNA pseudouridine38-40 synthase
MPVYRLDLAWRGDGFAGWQVQPGQPTVQGAIEQALSRVCGGAPASVRAAGRTDAGVHAAHQVAAAEVAVARPVEALQRGLLALLPPAVSVLDVQVAPEDFDPRAWSLEKHYRYRILTRRPRCPFRDGLVLHHPHRIDVERMARAAQDAVGRHDFSAFRAVGCGAAHAVRTIVAAQVSAAGDEVHIDVHGNGFLRHQVRILAGTLLEVGEGRRGVDAVQQAIHARDRAAAGPTAPAHGLWLMRAAVGAGPRAGARPRTDEPLDDDG